MAQMFLDHKYLYYDVDPFFFYVVCECDLQVRVVLLPATFPASAPLLLLPPPSFSPLLLSSSPPLLLSSSSSPFSFSSISSPSTPS